jgi:hypothetical protein
MGVVEAPNRQNWAEFPLVYSLNLQKQQVNWGKRCPKSYWNTLQNMLVNVQKFIETSLSKNYTKLAIRT